MSTSSSVSQAAPTTMPAVATSRVFFASLSAAQPLTAAQVDSGTGAHRALLSSSSTATPPRGRLERLISATAREVERELARAREQDSTAQQHPHDGDETISPSHQQDPSGGSRALRKRGRGAGRVYARSSWGHSENFAGQHKRKKKVDRGQSLVQWRPSRAPTTASRLTPRTPPRPR